MGYRTVAIALILIAGAGMLTASRLEAYWPVTPGWIAPLMAADPAQLTPQAAHDLIQAHRPDSDLVVLDVRTPAEVAEGHLPQAKTVNFYADNFPQNISQLDRQKTYLVYCRRGVRSDRTLQLMKEMGFEQVYNLRGGIHGWRRAGLPLSQEPIQGDG